MRAGSHSASARRTTGSSPTNSLPYDKPARIVRDYLDVLDAAFAGPGAVAVDNDSYRVHSPIDVTDAFDMPVLVDRDHTLTELYAISNVPTVVWIDERDRITRPNAVAFGTDTFREFTGVDSEPHKDAVRAWVRTGRVDVEGVEPIASVLPMQMKKRVDVVTDGGIADDVLANAPAKEDHYFVVPKVIE